MAPNWEEIIRTVARARELPVSGGWVRRVAEAAGRKSRSEAIDYLERRFDTYGMTRTQARVEMYERQIVRLRKLVRQCRSDLRRKGKDYLVLNQRVTR